MDENLRTKNRQHGNFCPKKLFLVSIYYRVEYNIPSKHHFDQIRVYPVKISFHFISCHFIDFGKDFLQIKKLIGQCLCFRKILWFYLRRVIERSQCYYFLLENTCLVNLYIFNRQMICSHHFGMTI